MHKVYDRPMLLLLQILQKYRLKSHNTEMGMIHMPFTVPDRPVLIDFTPRQKQTDAGRPPYLNVWQSPTCGLSACSCYVSRTFSYLTTSDFLVPMILFFILCISCYHVQQAWAIFRWTLQVYIFMLSQAFYVKLLYIYSICRYFHTWPATGVYFIFY